MTEFTLQPELRTRYATSFAQWIVEAVSLHQPVFISRAAPAKLSPAVDVFARPLRMIKVPEEEILAFAAMVEAEAVARRDASIEQERREVVQLQQERAAHQQEFALTRAALMKKFGVSEAELLRIFQELTKLP